MADYDVFQTARTVKDHADRVNRGSLDPGHDLEMLLFDLLRYAHDRNIDFDVERAQFLARPFVPIRSRVPAGSASARQKWPKSDGSRTLEQYVEDRLRGGSKAPFDADYSGEEDAILPDPGDWAMRAARAIIDDFDDRAAALNEAFHIEKIEHETRIEIIDVMAAIMREALRQEGEAATESAD